MNRILTITLPAPILCAVSLTVTADPKAYSKYPTGEGDPAAITCRPPRPQSGTWIRGPEVCRTNAVWAQYRKQRLDVATGGVRLMRAPGGASGWGYGQSRDTAAGNALPGPGSFPNPQF